MVRHAAVAHALWRTSRAALGVLWCSTEVAVMVLLSAEPHCTPWLWQAVSHLCQSSVSPDGKVGDGAQYLAVPWSLLCSKTHGPFPSSASVLPSAQQYINNIFT